MVAGLAMLVLCAVAVSSVGPLLLQRVINDALPHHHVRELAALCTAMIAAGILTGMLGITQGMLANRIGQRVVHDLRVGLFRHIQGMGLTFFAGDANTEIQARLVSDIGGISDILTLTAQGALTAMASLITACTVMLILSWPLALASIVLATALNVVNQRFAARRNMLAARRQEAVAGIMRQVAEDLSLPGVILGRTLGQTARQRARFTQTSARLSAATYEQRLAGRTAMATINMTFACLPPVIYLLSGTVVHGISLGTAVVLATMQARLTGPIQQLLTLSGTLQSSRAMFDRVFAYLDLPADELAGDDLPADDEDGLTGNHPSGPLRLMLRDVGYRYPHAARDALSDASVDFPPYSFTVITGPSGSGKSTLALLAAGLLRPSAGEIWLESPGDADQRVSRQAVTLVPQEPMLFNASIRENLLVARPQAGDGELSWAVRTASLTDLIERLPEGMETPVGERGYQLSGGERQRLALARALLSGRPVLIVDEGTSALDGFTADQVYQRLHQISAQRTVVMITHRIPRLTTDDRVVVVAGGRIAEQGCHGELLSRRGAYYTLLAAEAIEISP
jgi:ATP-binding cassette, subfamily B, bacterial